MSKCTHCSSTSHSSFYCPSKPRTPLRRNKALSNKPTVKLQEARKEYNKERDKFLDENSVCQYPECNSEDVTLHHEKGRIGKLLSDTRFFKALCPEHHTWAEQNPEEAKALGLSSSRLEKI